MKDETELKEICKTPCGFNYEGKCQCCAYCKYKDLCLNPCENTPYTCNETIGTDTELLDYALEQYINMDKIEFIEHYKEYKESKIK